MLRLRHIQRPAWNSHRSRSAIAIEVKRFPVVAETTYKDHTTRGQLDGITKLVEEANGGREIGFWTTYALVLVECLAPRAWSTI